MGLLEKGSQKIMKKKKGLICFDLDETLVSAKRCHWYGFNDAFKKYGLKQVRYKDFWPLLNGRRAHQVAKMLYPKLSDSKIDKIIKEHHKLIGTKYGKYSKQIGNVNQILKKIKKRFEIALVSNCSHKEINGLLRGAKIDRRLFDVIIGKDDVKKSKPAPDEIFMAEKLTHLNADFHVGDSPYDIIAGKKAKTKVISVLTGVTPKRKLQKLKPYKIIDSIKDLPKHIKLY